MRVYALLHAPFESLGVIAHWLNNKGFSLHETHTYRGDKLPNVADFDWLISMGGPQDLKEIKKYPYLLEEMSLIQKAINYNKVVLGVCLGAQLIAESLGAKTEKSPEPEIGIFPVSLTEQGSSDPIMRHFPDPFQVTHWHSDMPGLPAGAVILASSRGCPRQVIRFKANVYGLQCHFELTEEDIRAMVAHSPSDLVASRYVQTKNELLQQNYKAINQHMYLFLDHLAKVNAGIWA